MKTSRREFTLMSGAVAAGSLLGGAASPRALAEGRPKYDPKAWHQRLKRVMQVNFNEKDPEGFDVEMYADHLAACKAQATWLSVTNVVAFYPSTIPALPRSAYLNGRDIFGECVAALRKRNIRILGRLSPDLANSSLADKYPDWFRRSSDGHLVNTLEGNAAEFAQTCQFTSYYSDFIPHVMTEVVKRYEIDGIYTNGWPNISVPRCYCNICKAIGDPGSAAYRDRYQARAIDLWTLFEKTVSTAKPDAIFSGNLGGGFEGGEIDFHELAKDAVFFLADNQGRATTNVPAWSASQQVRIGKAIIGNRPVPLATGAYMICAGSWRNGSGNPDEVRSRLFQTAATGGTVYAHWLGYQQGFVEDRRWQAVTKEVLSWQADNDKHFHNRRSIASVGLVISMRSNRRYKPVPGSRALDSIDGIYRILTEGRVPFDIVLDTDLDLATVSRYKALILPNFALMSDLQAQQLKAYVAQGGSLLSTFETGLYDENGQSRPDFALADIYGMHKIGDRLISSSAAFSLQRIEQSHPLTASFEDTSWIHGSAARIPIAAEGNPILTDVPPYPNFPTENVYPRQAHTSVPTAVVRQRGQSRLVYLSNDVEGTYWRNSSGDLAQLMANSINWVVADERPIVVEGSGLIEIYGWETEPGYAVHLLNYTNPDFRGGAMRQTYALGDQVVRLTLRDSTPIKRARLLRAGTELAFLQKGAQTQFTISNLKDYEVAALEL